jgi:hypothetical protein
MAVYIQVKIAFLLYYIPFKFEQVQEYIFSKMNYFILTIGFKLLLASKLISILAAKLAC